MTTDLAVANAPSDLLSFYDEIAVPAADSNRVEVPILHVFMGKGTKYTDKKAKEGFVIDWGADRVEVNIDEVRLSQIWWFSTRIMWPYDDKGTRLQPENENEKLKPLCASGNGISPRKNEIFGYIGSKFVDWRDHKEVTIVEDGCAQCPLGQAQWAGLYDKDGNALMGEDDRGRPKQLTAASPCSELHAFLFWDHDRNTFLLYKAQNYSADKFLMGRLPHKTNGMKGIQGVPFFTNTPKGKEIPLVFGDGTVVDNRWTDFRPLIVRPYDYQTAKKLVPVAKFELGNTPLTDEEYDRYNEARNEFKINPMYRDYVTGDIFERFDHTEEPVTKPVTSEVPF